MTKRQRSASPVQADDADEVSIDRIAHKLRNKPSSPRSRADSSAADKSDGSDDSDNSDNSDKSEIINVTAQQKPHFSMPSTSNPRELRDRLRAFLPMMASANAGLKGRAEESLERVDDGDDQYISMDLGLGVLEERRSTSDSSSDSKDEELSRSASDAPTSVRPATEHQGDVHNGDPRESQHGGAMSELLGSSAKKFEKPVIQEVTTGDG